MPRPLGPPNNDPGPGGTSSDDSGRNLKNPQISRSKLLRTVEDEDGLLSSLENPSCEVNSKIGVEAERKNVKEISMVPDGNTDCKVIANTLSELMN